MSDRCEECGGSITPASITPATDREIEFYEQGYRYGKFGELPGGGSITPADQEDTDASNDMPGASSLRSRSGDAVNAETTSLDGGGRQPGIERIMGRIVITSALNLEVPGLTQSQYDRMADAAMDALINGDCLRVGDLRHVEVVAADQEDTERKEWRCAPGEHDWQRFPQISDGIVCAKCGADQEDTDA